MNRNIYVHLRLGPPKPPYIPIIAPTLLNVDGSYDFSGFFDCTAQEFEDYIRNNRMQTRNTWLITHIDHNGDEVRDHGNISEFENIVSVEFSLYQKSEIKMSISELTAL